MAARVRMVAPTYSHHSAQKEGDVNQAHIQNRLVFPGLLPQLSDNQPNEEEHMDDREYNLEYVGAESQCKPQSDYVVPETPIESIPPSVETIIKCKVALFLLVFPVEVKVDSKEDEEDDEQLANHDLAC